MDQGQHPFHLKNPIRALRLTFLSGMLLVLVAMPFVPFPKLEFLGIGIVYSALLSVFAIGLLVCPSVQRNWWIIIAHLTTLAALIAVRAHVPSRSVLRWVVWIYDNYPYCA